MSWNLQFPDTPGRDLLSFSFLLFIFFSIKKRRVQHYILEAILLLLYGQRVLVCSLFVLDDDNSNADIGSGLLNVSCGCCFSFIDHLARVVVVVSRNQLLSLCPLLVRHQQQVM